MGGEEVKLSELRDQIGKAIEMVGDLEVIDNPTKTFKAVPIFAHLKLFEIGILSGTKIGENERAGEYAYLDLYPDRRTEEARNTKVAYGQSEMAYDAKALVE